MKKYKNMILLGITILICLLIDQIIKLYITSSFDLATSVHIIRNFFRITYVHNMGAAWSIFSGNSLFLIGTGIFSIIVLFYFYYKEEKKYPILFGCLLGGILGNLIDRIRFGYVIDYIDLNFGSYYYPIFNMADIFIVIAVILLIFKIITEEGKDENRNRRKSKPKN